MSDWRSKWPRGVVEDEIGKLKAEFGEEWQAMAAAAVIDRKGSVVAALELAFQAGKHGVVPFIEWLDRETIAAYVHINPCNTSQQEVL